MLKTKLLLLLPVLLLQACATTGPSDDPEPEVITQTRIVDNSCVGFKPVYVQKTDIIADETAKQILANNLYGAKKCGWKPKSK